MTGFLENILLLNSGFHPLPPSQGVLVNSARPRISDQQSAVAGRPSKTDKSSSGGPAHRATPEFGNVAAVAAYLILKGLGRVMNSAGVDYGSFFRDRSRIASSVPELRKMLA
ncbi:hypothetical protein GWI33_016766 [Rhynchophorus ferrugineus]|uniref:Uncharacterized protein n=1 Tax=Rhynchophorus ferrugineus TaxID=354439 RepID=A0A834I0A5_RHYFE|nr:hypothetical protein GWI33_016766 [Rhynchophorus ferrugineus]